MMADLMDRFLSNPDIVFIVSSLSKAELARQNYEKFIEYQSTFNTINPYIIKSDFAEEEKIYIPTGYNVYVLPRDLYKDKSRIKTSGAFANLLLSLKFSGKYIYLIKDECHIATSNLDALNDDFSRIINFSATPRFVPDVEITSEEAVRCKLIKRVAEDSYDGSMFTVNPNASISEAIDKFMQIKEEYINKLKVNPCLIIQISNKDRADEEWARIKKIVSDPTKNLKWMYIVDDNNSKACDTNDSVKKLPVSKWKDYVKNKESLIDVIIFKMVITEGWDIPRACMLYQVRDSKSKMMDEQVLGRVRRNPILVDWENYDEEAHELALTCWVWGLIDGDMRKFKKVSVIDNKNLKVKTTKLNSLQHDKTFDFKRFINSKPFSINTVSIFDLYKNWNKISQDTAELCRKNIKTYDDWIKISNYLLEIDELNNAFMANYESSMELDEIAEFSKNSYFEITGSSTEIENWSWEMNDSEDDEYHFDSEAERDFAKILKKLKAEIWGKNFYPNSTIKFEYVLNNKHTSYPDFVLKDINNTIHIFEVKSVNAGGNQIIEAEDYVNKIEALRVMFITASKITKQVFYLPIKVDSDWKIYRLLDGKEDVLTKDSFIQYIKPLI